MELSQLRYFIAIAELGNMSKAAEVLFVSQPNLSTSISRLEEEVGAPLFERRRGKITLNQNGALLLSSVKKAVAILDDGVQKVRAQNQGQAAGLSLACMIDDTALLERFVLENPEINLIQKRADLPTIISLLGQGKADLALTVLQPPEEDIAYERIYSCPFVLVMSQDHPLARYPAITRRQLMGQRLAIDGSRINRDSFYAAENAKFGMAPVIAYDVRHMELLLSLVKSNGCISIIPAVKYKELYLKNKVDALVCRAFAEGSPDAYWGIAHNKRCPLNAQGLKFRAFVRNYFEEIDAKYAALTGMT